MAVRTLTYVLLGRDELSPTVRKAGAEVEGTFTRLGKLTALAGLSFGIGEIGVAAVKSAIDFQSSMEKVHTQAGAAQRDIGTLSQSVLSLATRTQQGPEKLAESLYHLKSVGMDNADAMKALKQASDLAAVGGANLEDTTNALAGAWRSGIKGAQSFGETAATVNAIIGAGNMRMEDLVAAIGTGILPSARTFGVSLRSVGAALALMTDEGVPAIDAATRIRMSLSLLGAPSGAAEKQLKMIGLTGLDLANTMRSPGGLVATIALLKDHLDKSGMSASEQAALLSRAFGGGRSSSAILTMVNNLDVLRKKQDQINATTGKYGDAVAQQRKTAQAQFAILRSVVETLGVRLGTALLPPLTRFAQYLTSTAIPRMLEIGTKVAPVVKSVFSDFATGISTIAKGISLLPGPVKVATAAIVALGIAMKIAAANPWTALAVALVIAVGLIVKNWKSIGPVFFAVMHDIRAGWNTFIGFFVNTFHTLQGIAVGVWHAIENNFFGKALILAVKLWWIATKATFQIAFDIISGIFLLIAAVGRAAWQKIVAFWRIEWAILRPILQLMGTVVAAIFVAIYKSADNAWHIIYTAFAFVWRTLLRPVLGTFLNVILTTFGTIVHAAAWAFGWVPGLGPKLKDAAKHFDEFKKNVQNAIDGINGKTVKVGVKMFAGQGGGTGGSPPIIPAATGRKVTGPGGPRDDRAGLFALSNGEWVIRQASAARYGDRAMQAVNEGRAVIGYANGGAVGLNVQASTPSAGSISHDINSTLSKLVIAAIKNGLFGSGAAIVSYARSFLGRIPYVWGGTAVPGGADCSGFVQSVYRRFGINAPRTSEAQYSWARKTGPVPGGLAFYISPAGGPPPGHVAIVADSGHVISQGGGMGPQWENLHFMPLMGTGVPPGGLPGFMGSGGNGPIRGTNQQIAMALLNQRGWGNQWGSFNALEMREAGWNMNARNPSSGAYGMAQFINGAGEYAQYGGNWYTATGQLIAMMNYIAQRYGNPARAWQHELSAGWYAKGTNNARKGWAVVGESGPEIVNFRGGEQVMPLGRGGGQTIVWTGDVVIQGHALADKASVGRVVKEAIAYAERHGNR